MSVLEELRRTPKGQLKYDRQGLCMQSIEGVLTDIQSDMDSMQVRLSSPATFSPEPSFGLSSPAEPGSPLVVRTVRLVTPSPAACGNQYRNLKSIRVTLQNNATKKSNVEELGRNSARSLQSIKITADLATPKIGNRMVNVAAKSDISLSPVSSTALSPVSSTGLSPVSSIELSPASPQSLMKPWPGRHSTPLASRTIDLSDITPVTPQTMNLSETPSKHNAGTDLNAPESGESLHGVSALKSAPKPTPEQAPQEVAGNSRLPKDSREHSSSDVTSALKQVKNSPRHEAIAENESENAPVNHLLNPGSSGNSPFTPRTHDKMLQKERQKHLEEAKEEGRVRLAAAEAQLQQLRRQHQLAQQQLAAEQLRRQLEQRQRHGAQQLLSQQQLQQTSQLVEQQRQKREQELRALLERRQADAAAVRQRAVQQRLLLDQMIAAQKQLRTAVTNVVNKIKCCEDRARLQAGPAAQQVERLRALMAQMEALVRQPAAEPGVRRARALVDTAQQLETLVCTQIDEINAPASPEQEAPPAPSTALAAAPPAEGAASVAQVAPPVPAQSAAAVEKPRMPGELSSSLQEAQQRYDSLRLKLAQFQASFADILTDPRWKKFKFDCQKAVNTPINAISPVSSAHLKDKLEKLRTLLRGRPTPLAGHSQVTAADHPHGVSFCLDLVAKKFVRQGEDVVSSKPEAAFALAAVFAALEREFPPLAELTAAHLLATCPYLAPVYPQQLADETDQQYYRKLGYDYSDGVVERQDKFLKRMSGCARLYAALLLGRPPQGTPPAPAGAAAPLHLGHAWNWLSAIANLEPRADITASLLLDVLDVAGSALAAAYGRQFFKLVRLLETRYMPRLQQVTPEGCGGPVVRLQQRLQGIVTSGRVPPPVGQLKLYGW